MSSFVEFWQSLLGWFSPPDDPDEEEAVRSGDRTASRKPAAPAKKYAEIQAALEARLNYLVRHEVLEHQEFAENDVLELHHIEIECAPGGEPLLQEFFKEFNQAARQSWVRKLLGGANGLVKLDCFTGVYGGSDLPAAAGNLDRHAQMLGQGAPAAYQVHLLGRWVQRPAPARVEEEAARPGLPVTLDILDALGRRQEQRRQYPLVIGRNGQRGVAVAGTFVSGEHAVLHFDGGRFWLEDRSRNGTWIDGQKAEPGRRVELQGNLYRLKLGKAAGDAKDCPEIALEILRTPVADPGLATPVATANATPILAPSGLLAVLAVVDATGRPQRDVTQVPFTIGRGPDRDYTTSPAHAGVSSRHLVIEAVTDRGAEVLNEAHDKNGTALGETLQPERFFWPFDAEIVLAPKWRKDPPVRITLKRPG
jgi:hypothetical protein